MNPPLFQDTFYSRTSVFFARSIDIETAHLRPLLDLFKTDSTLYLYLLFLNICDLLLNIYPFLYRIPPKISVLFLKKDDFDMIDFDYRIKTVRIYTSISM